MRKVDALIKFCIVAAATLSAITLIMLIVGSLIAELVLGISASVLTKMIDDVSFPATDAITFAAPVAPGTTFDRAFNFEIGDVKGEYQASVSWVTA